MGDQNGGVKGRLAASSSSGANLLASLPAGRHHRGIAIPVSGAAMPARTITVDRKDAVRRFRLAFAALAASLAAVAVFAARAHAEDEALQPTLSIACSIPGEDGKSLSFQLDFNEPKSLLLRTDNHKPTAAATLGRTEIVFELKSDSGGTVTRINRNGGALTATVNTQGALTGSCKRVPDGATSF